MSLSAKQMSLRSFEFAKRICIHAESSKGQDRQGGLEGRMVALSGWRGAIGPRLQVLDVER